MYIGTRTKGDEICDKFKIGINLKRYVLLFSLKTVIISSSF